MKLCCTCRRWSCVINKATTDWCRDGYIVSNSNVRIIKEIQEVITARSCNLTIGCCMIITFKETVLKRNQDFFFLNMLSLIRDCSIRESMLISINALFPSKEKYLQFSGVPPMFQLVRLLFKWSVYQGAGLFFSITFLPFLMEQPHQVFCVKQ